MLPFLPFCAHLSMDIADLAGKREIRGEEIEVSWGGS